MGEFLAGNDTEKVSILEKELIELKETIRKRDSKIKELNEKVIDLSSKLELVNEKLNQP